MLNPKNAGGHCVESWNTEKFSRVDDLKNRLCEEFSDYMLGCNISFGYIVPGHGLKGKQRVISTDDDLATMYDEYRGKRCVMMWIKCERGVVSKRQRSSVANDEMAPKAKRAGCSPGYASHMKNMAEVEEILEKLTEKHQENYTPEQLHAWAHMKKHSSYDAAPMKPFFAKKGQSQATQEAPIAISPLKKITLRSECIQQLSQWHQLMEKGAVSAEDYRDMQQTILKDIKRY